MPVQTWPTQAKIVRADLRLNVPNLSNTSPLNGRQMRGARLAEMWMGEIVLAPRLRADLDALAAWVETLRGRSGTFEMPLAGGFLSKPGIGSGVVVTAVAAARSVTVGFTSTGVTLEAGTLIQIGETDAANMQIVEVVADVTTSASTVVSIVPALRKSYSAGTAVKSSDVTGRFRLLDDSSGATRFGIGYGTATLSIVEVPTIEAVTEASECLLDDDGSRLMDDDGVSCLQDDVLTVSNLADDDGSLLLDDDGVSYLLDAA
jgi:hypothetical protein